MRIRTWCDPLVKPARIPILTTPRLVSKPINVTILPFATFSLFHCATFLRTNVLPKFYA